jgi:23S rRNA pseudouridine2605 synthase
MLIRINKVIADAGIASRREADRLIKAGEVSVNGQVLMEPGLKVDPANDHIKVRGKLVKPVSRKIYILLNKPKGYVTTTVDPQGRPTVLDLVKKIKGRVFPVGRLDFQSEGLLILTNDGEFAQKVMKPKEKIRKIYDVKIRGQLNENLKKRLEYGIDVEGEKMHLDRVEIIKSSNNTWLRVTLTQGKNRQIRKIFDAIQHPAVKIKRIQIGSLKAPSLKPGEYILLEDYHLKKILERSTN